MTKVYIDITQFMQIDAITGIQRVMRELMVRLLKRTDLETELIVWRHERQRYVKVDNAKMCRYLETGRGRYLRHGAAGAGRPGARRHLFRN